MLRVGWMPDQKPLILKSYMELRVSGQWRVLVTSFKSRNSLGELGCLKSCVTCAPLGPYFLYFVHIRG